MFASKDLFFTRPSGYQISRSVRTRSSASAYFNRTFGSPTSSTIWTWSGWVKLGSLSINRSLFSAFNGAGTAASITINGSDQLQLESAGGSVATSTAVFRDPSAWYHIVCSVNGSSTTIYVNNASRLTYSGGALTSFNTNTVVHNIGRRLSASPDFYFDGYLTEINFIDGQALTPSSFGTTNALTGVWQPAKYTGTYGTNGFYLNFSDNSNNTATTIGKDNSGNGNNWTPNNISVTAGVTYDSMLDVPTPYADGGNGRGNYAVLNATQQNSTGQLSQGNLSLTGTGAYKTAYATFVFPSTGKWYWEGVFQQANNNLGFGCASIGPNAPPNPLPNTNGIGIASNGFWYLDTSTGTSGHTGWSASTVVGMTWDSSTNTFSYTVDGTTYSTVGSVSTTDGRQWCPACWAFATNDQLALNFGQRPFSYTPPTGFVALNTQNLPTPTISNGANYMAATLYTGTNANLTITNVNGFQPDMLWIKDRTNAYAANIQDSVRGSHSVLIPSLTNAEATSSGTTGVLSFNSNGFSLGLDTSTTGSVNGVGDAYVAWQWQAGKGSTSSNTNGSITSTVSAGATQGFSVVTYTGTGANATVGHGLGVAPKMIIVKLRSGSAGTTAWVVYHSSDNASPQSGYMRLDGTGAFASDTTAWNNTAPTSSVFSIGTLAAVNYAAANNYVAYCFSAVAGYSAFGSYTGNGSADGPFVYFGFRPRFVMWKRSDAVSDWEIVDAVRPDRNVVTGVLYANLSNAEVTSSGECDFTSNGFKIRDNSNRLNTNGGTYIYMAFAENPFKNSLAR